MKYLISNFIRRLIIVLLAAGAGFSGRLYAEEQPAFQFQIKATAHSLTLEVNDSPTLGSPVLNLQVQTTGSAKLLWEGRLQGVRTGGVISFKADNLQPLLWSPTQPQLYNLIITLSDQGREIQKASYRIGFRDFETKGGKIYLNGHPIFLRGIAINPPGRGIPSEVETDRTFAEEYIRFMKSINVNIIRIPDDQTWYDVCDELGMMVFGGNYSATVAGENPPENYDDGVFWYENEKFQPLMHHPSLMIYALTNEVPYTGEIAKKWQDFLDYAYKQLKKWDGTRLYIGNAGYGYGHGGDICDLHRYWGWYYASPFTFLNIRDYEQITSPDKVQPLTFTECVGNYTGPDGRYNLTPNHKNPVSQLNWTGHAPLNEQAQLADQHQSFVFKQATELMRRLRRINPESSGVFPFTILFLNWHTVKTFSDMDPKPVAWQARISFQPVLLSWENWQPQVYSGTTIHPIAHLINDSDDFSNLVKVRVVVRLLDKAYTHWISDTLNLPDIPYYGIHSEKINIKLPENLFSGYYKLEGIVLADGKEVSRNSEPLFIGRAERGEMIGNEKVLLYDIQGLTQKALNNNQINATLINSFSGLKPVDCLVIGENSANKPMEQSATIIKDFVSRGGRLIILRQDSIHQSFVKQILPVEVGFPQMDIDDPSYPPPPRPSENSFNINPERTNHPVFSGITRSELRVWSDYTQWDETRKGFPAIYPVTNGFILKNKSDLDKTAILANYSVGLEGIALAEIFYGKGSVLLSGFDLSNRSAIDPIADRLLSNMIRYMSGKYAHEKYIYIDSPILWGEYETEKGLLTGIYSGLMLNSKPALFGSYENLPLVLLRDGHLFGERGGGWNNAAGKEYVPYGRRMFGPYFHRDFGGVPFPLDTATRIGEGTFWCKVPDGTSVMETLAWNPAKENLPISIKINDEELISATVGPGEYKVLQTTVKSNQTNLKVSLRGDRRLVILQTSFN
ncbi:MAG: glycosyl hydrolase family 2 [Bacteroidia bacterium]|nr:glycosyl hydrolase family 2 [Bacteroidia bacterium]